MRLLVIFFALCGLCEDLRAIKITFSGPDIISESGKDAHSPVCKLDNEGNVTAIFIQNDILVSAFLPLEGLWTNPKVLSEGPASSPELTVDMAGNVSAIWLENNALKTATKNKENVWGDITILSSAAKSPKIAASASGDLVAVWMESSKVHAKIKKIGELWPDSSIILSSSEAAKPALSVGPEGTIGVAWQAPSENIPSIWGAIGDTTSATWSEASLLSKKHAVNPAIFVGYTGNVVVGWFSYDFVDSAYRNVSATAIIRKASDDAWPAPETLSSGGLYHPDYLKICVTETFNEVALALWKNSYFPNSFTLEFSTKKHYYEDAWIPPDILTADAGLLDFDLSIFSYVINSAVFMVSREGSKTIRASAANIESYLRHTWSMTGRLCELGDNFAPKLDGIFSSASQMLYGGVVWEGYEEPYRNVQATFAAITVVFPPTNVQVRAIRKDHKNWKERRHIITWEKSPSPHIQKYVVYRNDSVIGVVDASTFTFTDRHRIEGEHSVYQVAAIDKDVLESPKSHAVSP